MPKVSVIVPVYNVEKYLNECIDSILNQTLKDIEVICVNDGSTDDSLKILQDYAQKDNRIKIINKENSGYGASMNRGIQAASGEYIGIIESDDFVAPEMFEDLYNLAVKNHADIAKSNWYDYTTKYNQKQKFEQFNKDETISVINIKEKPYILNTFPAVWSAIYKREFLLNEDLKFLETPGASYQDCSFGFKTLAMAERIILTTNAYVCYRQDNVNSSIKSKGKVYAICKEYEEIDRFLDKYNEIKNYVNTEKLKRQYFSFLWNATRIDKKFVPEFLEKFHCVFKNFYEKGEITEDFFKTIDKYEVELLIKSPVLFDKELKKRKRREIRRKICSIRLKPTQISVVILGKQLINIGR